MIEVIKEDTFGDYELSILHDTLGVKRFVVLLTGPWGKGGESNCTSATIYRYLGRRHSIRR